MSDGEMLTLQKINKLAAAKAWILRVQRVNMLHEFLFILPLLLVLGVLVIDNGTIQVYELALTADREFILRIYHIPERAGRMPESNPGESHVQA